MELLLEGILLVFFSNGILLCTASVNFFTVQPSLATVEKEIESTEKSISAPITEIYTTRQPIVISVTGKQSTGQVISTNNVTTLLSQNDTSTRAVTNTHSVTTPITPGDTSTTSSLYTHSVISGMPTETSANSRNCPSGFVHCADGNCEPYESLCGEGGIVTVVFPTDVTTGSPERSTGHLSSGFSKAVTDNTLAATTPTVQVTTTPVVLATDSNGHEICLDGWELCMDGTCEPFHWLCTEHDGSANFTTLQATEAPPTSPVVTLSPAVTLSPVVTLQPIVTEAVLETSTAQMVQTTTSQMVPETTVTDIVPQIVTSSSGTCPNGFVQCVDGTCEPFEALCGDQGIVTVTFQTNLPTTGTLSPVSGSAVTSKSTLESLSTSTTVPTSTTTFAVATDSSKQFILFNIAEIKCV
ncbi:mucin-2-like [Ruditapes philippinarum]|uniref:mucin-2-like n=1 Tax=Ruditapes philippinarum TaxID=129788 RepID=UPI00295BDA6C|nr:mucin-2-like [Ruditapes philippinarum]